MTYELIEQLARNWFLVFYAAVGIVFLIQGTLWLFRPSGFTAYLYHAAATQQRPPMLLKALRYFFLFTFLSVVLSFFPFSLFELLFALLCLALVYVLATFFLRWETLRHMIRDHRQETAQLIRGAGGLLLLMGVLALALLYRYATMHFS